MFARKILHIPSPGRHPPSTGGSDAPDNHGSEQTPLERRTSDFLESFKLGSSPLHNVSPAMSTLQGYYGLQPAEENSHYPGNGNSTKSTPPNAISRYRKCKSVAFDLHAKSIQTNQEESKETDSDKWIESLSRWRKSEFDLSSKAPVTLLKEEVSNIGGFSALGSTKGLALRPKAVARAVSGTNNGVRKSFSTPSLQDAENGTSSWLKSKWNSKPDMQGLSTGAITKPIYDGIAIPIGGKKTKAALD